MYHPPRTSTVPPNAIESNLPKTKELSNSGVEKVITNFFYNLKTKYSSI